jgi:hypothetical protein
MAWTCPFCAGTTYDEGVYGSKKCEGCKSITTDIGGGIIRVCTPPKGTPKKHEMIKSTHEYR